MAEAKHSDRAHGHAGGRPESIRWLLSDEASYVAGAVLPVTGAMRK
jgi:hypothetical protein